MEKPTSPRIDALIIGAQKSGTTSLKSYLNQHPEISTHTQLELGYFSVEEEYKKGEPFLWEKYFTTPGPSVPIKKIIAKNATLYTEELGIQRLYQHNPYCQLLFILRNPVDRAFSYYKVARNGGWLNREFEELFEAIRKYEAGEYDMMYKIIVQMGLYSKFLKKIYTIFPREQVHIYLFEQLIQNPERICQDICNKLGVSEDFSMDYSSIQNQTVLPRSPHFNTIKRWLFREENPFFSIPKKLLPAKTTSYLGTRFRQLNKSNIPDPSRIDPKTRKRLAEFYRPHNEDLQNMVQLDVLHWNT